MKPARLDLSGGRHVPFAETWLFLGDDYSGASFAMQLRLMPEASGDPLVNLVTVATASAEGVRLVYGGTDTVTNHLAAGRMEESDIPSGATGSTVLALSQIGVRINKSTMENMPPAATRGADLDLSWDLILTPAGGLADRILEGRFTLDAGTTR